MQFINPVKMLSNRNIKPNREPPNFALERDAKVGVPRYSATAASEGTPGSTEEMSTGAASSPRAPVTPSKGHKAAALRLR